MNKTDWATVDILSVLPSRVLVSLHLGPLSETKRETIFEKPSIRSEANSVSSIGWLWFNDVPNVSERNTHFQYLSTIRGGRERKCTSEESLPLTAIYRITGASKLILKIGKMQKSALFGSQLYQLVGLRKM